MIQWQGRCHCPPDRPIPSRTTKVDDAKCLACDDTTAGGWENTIQLEYDTSVYQTAHYCNRHNGEGYSYICAKGTVGISANETIKRKVDGVWTDFKGPNYGECVPCSEIDVSALKYEAQCLSCGGDWIGANWYTGSCEP